MLIRTCFAMPFGDQIAKRADLRVAQALLGHASVRHDRRNLLRKTRTGRACRQRPRLLISAYRELPLARTARYASRGDDRNRTGVNGFAGRCVATPPRRREGSKRSVRRRAVGRSAQAVSVSSSLTVQARPLVAFVPGRAISSAGRAPPRQGGGRWFEPSIAH